MKLLRKALGLEWLVVIAAAPVLAFPTVRPRWTAGALAVLAALWLLRWLVRGKPWPVTPFNGPLLLFAVMIPVGVWASAFPDLTARVTPRLVLGLAAFRASALAVEDEGSLDLALIGFCLLGLGIAAVGALGVRWPGKAGVLGVVTERIPRLIECLPEDKGTPGVNPNHLAGGIVLYLPLGLALVARAWQRPRGVVLRILAVVGAAVFVVAIGGVLLLTQSRSAWIGSVGGICALGVLAGLTSRRRAVRVLGAAVPVVAVAAVVAVVAMLGPQQVLEIVYDSRNRAALEETIGRISMAGRVEIWTRAVYAIRDFPLTGCGLGAFSRVIRTVYPPFSVAPDRYVGHAHNIFLQTATDLGLPGLVAYVAVLVVAVGVCWRCARRTRGGRRSVALGLAAGLIGLQLYGVTDAVALWEKPAAVFWFALGLVAALAGNGTQINTDPH